MILFDLNNRFYRDRMGSIIQIMIYYMIHYGIYYGIYYDILWYIMDIYIYIGKIYHLVIQIPYKWRFIAGKIIYKWAIFHGYVK